MSEDEDISPLALQMRRNLAAAEKALADEEAERRGQQSQAGNVFALAWMLEHFWHWFAMCLGFTIAFAAAAWCFYLLNAFFAAGRVMATGVGMLNAFVASYASRYFLASIEATFEGVVELDNMSFFDWKEWFWTLPSTIGGIVWSVLIGYLLSIPVPEFRPLVVGVAILVTHPFFVLSTLATDSPLLPVSWEVVKTWFRNPVAWLLFYTVWLAIWTALYLIVRRGLMYQPILMISLCGPAFATIVVGYGLALGNLARHFHETSEEEDDDE